MTRYHRKGLVSSVSRRYKIGILCVLSILICSSTLAQDLSTLSTQEKQIKSGQGVSILSTNRFLQTHDQRTGVGRPPGDRIFINSATEIDPVTVQHVYDRFAYTLLEPKQPALNTVGPVTTGRSSFFSAQQLDETVTVSRGAFFEEVELILDDGNGLPDLFLGHGFTAPRPMVWSNVFVMEESTQLEEILFNMRTEFATTNSVRLSVSDTSGTIVSGDLELDLVQDGGWFLISLGEPISFEAGDLVFVFVEALNTNIGSPAGIDRGGNVPMQSFYLDYFTERFQSVSNLEGLENGAFLIRALGSVGANTPPSVTGTIDPNPADVGELITFDASGSTDPDGQIISYLWEFGDGTTSQQAVATHSYTMSGEYNITLTVTDNDGASASATGVVGVSQNTPPVAVGTISPDPASNPLFVGQTIMFDASGSIDSDGQVISYLWEFGDGAASGQAMTSYAYDSPGTYTVTLTVTDDQNATDTITGEVVILEANMPPVASGRISPDPLTTPLFVGQTIAFDASASEDPDGQIVSYLWDFGDGSTSLEVIATHEYSSPGEYTVTLTVTDNTGASAAAAGTLFIAEIGGNLPPMASGFVSSFQVTVGETVTFDASASQDPDGEIISYLWEFGDGQSSSEVIATHQYTTPGIYTAVLTVIDDLGASSAIGGDIMVSGSSIPRDTSSVAIEDNELGAPNAWSLEPNYPNPFNPSTTIPFTILEATQVRLVVFDMLGREVSTLANGLYPSGSHSVIWDAQGLPSGLYVYRLEANGEMQTRTMNLLK